MPRHVLVWYDMAIGDTAQSGLTLTTVEEVPADASVRHFDELSHRAQRRFLRLVEEGTVPREGDGALSAGEVVVFTEYYRVRRR
jgi:hypothetical protein